RRLCKQRAEGLVIEPREVGKMRRGERRAGRKLRLAALLGEFVPWADREAIVAPVDAVADQRAQRMRDRPFVLDREIRNAAPGIEPIGRRESVGRAHVEAGATGAAVILL